MTNPHPLTEVEVTQADREAAAELGDAVFCHPDIVAQAFARHRLSTSAQPSTEAVKLADEPAAWLHTMHMEAGQTARSLTHHDGPDEDEPKRTAFGIPGRDYSEEYTVTSEPLFLRQPPLLPSGEKAIELMRRALITARSAIHDAMMPDGLYEREAIPALKEIDAALNQSDGLSVGGEG